MKLPTPKCWGVGVFWNVTCVTELFPAFQRIRVPPSSGTFSPRIILRWLNPNEGSLLLLQALQLQSSNVLTLSTYDFHLLWSWIQLIQFFIFNFFMSFLMSSSHLFFGLPWWRKYDWLKCQKLLTQQYSVTPKWLKASATALWNLGYHWPHTIHLELTSLLCEQMCI
jgi:hypothetical protein